MESTQSTYLVLPDTTKNLSAFSKGISRHLQLCFMFFPQPANKMIEDCEDK